GQVISLNQQIKNFEGVTLPDLERQLGCKSSESLPSYLIVVGTGGNDYTFNYFMRESSINNNNNSSISNNVSLEAFTANLITTLSAQLKRLYELGGRKFVLMSLNPIGCSPMVNARLPMRKGCAQKLNLAAHLFNTHLKSLVDLIKPHMPGSNLVYVNSYKVIRDIIKNPTSKGFSDASNPSCEVASISEGGSGVLCKRGGTTCANRTIHVFFDGLHPTEAVNDLIARNAYASNLQTQVYPINVKQLAQI
ncbi:GDSL esterase/lipase, partial [Camellia lanceoleosa]